MALVYGAIQPSRSSSLTRWQGVYVVGLRWGWVPFGPALPFGSLVNENRRVGSLTIFNMKTETTTTNTAGVTLPAEYLDPKYLALHELVRGKIRDNWSLCNFTGDCESEMMMAQTLHAGKLNLKDQGSPFSFRGNGCLNGYTAIGGGQDNARGYSKLIQLRYIQEVEVPSSMFPGRPANERYENNGEKIMLLFITELGLQAMNVHAEKNN